MWFLLVFAAGAFALKAYQKYEDERQRQPPIDVKPSVKVGLVARGDAPAPSSMKVIPSPIPGVDPRAWTKFAMAMKTAKLGNVSPSNAVGCFEIMPRRLVDLGILENANRIKSPVSGRTVVVGDFVPPMTADKFLASPPAQYNAFADSMKNYAARIRGGELTLPEGVTLSGGLAICHRCGPNGLATWGDETKRFPATAAVVEAANGVF